MYRMPNIYDDAAHLASVFIEGFQSGFLSCANHGHHLSLLIKHKRVVSRLSEEEIEYLESNGYLTPPSKENG